MSTKTDLHDSKMNYIEELGKDLISFLHSIPSQYNKQGLLVCLSGGVDSALNLKLCAQAVGKERVLAVIMEVPSLNKQEDMAEAQAWAQELGVPFVRLDLTHFFNALHQTFPFLDEHAQKITLNRLRLSIAYTYADRFGYSIVSSGNYSEEVTRPIVLHGSGSGDCFPYTSLYKTEIYALAKHFQLPQKILDKAPSDGFIGNYTDMDSIGDVRYSDVDKILHALVNQQYKADQATDPLAIHLATLHSKFSRQLDFPTFIAKETQQRTKFIQTSNEFPYERTTNPTC